MKKLIKLKVVKYYLDISKEAEKKEYYALAAKCENDLGYKLFDIFGESKIYEKLGNYVNIETDLLFNNQYNTKEGFRVFDWSESIYTNRNIKQGYYLDGENLEELKTAKDNQLICGYCGARYWKDETDHHFCNKCIHSPTLTTENLFLLELKPVSSKDDRSSKKVIPNNLLEEYEKRGEVLKAARSKRMKEQAIKIVDDAKKENEINLYEAKVKAGLLNAGIDVENLIYYNHTGEWMLGWRENVTREVFDKYMSLASLLDLPIDKNGICFVNILHGKIK